MHDKACSQFVQYFLFSNPFNKELQESKHCFRQCMASGELPSVMSYGNYESIKGLSFLILPFLTGPLISHYFFFFFIVVSFVVASSWSYKLLLKSCECSKMLSLTHVAVNQISGIIPLYYYSCDKSFMDLVQSGGYKCPVQVFVWRADDAIRAIDWCIGPKTYSLR